jgi:HEAT repeat protein
LIVSTEQDERPEPRDEEIADLVRGLDNLRWNLQVQADVLRLGERAVPALIDFLHGPTSQFPEGRVLAAEALGRIGGEGAFQGLLKALHPRRVEHLSPVLRLSEETVQDAVARQLGRLGDRRAVPALIEALRLHCLLGAAEALAQFREPNALPGLVRALEDAFKRDRLSGLVLEWGRAAIPHLMATLEQRRTNEDEELLPSLERRAEALRLLGLLHAGEAVNSIRSALRDRYAKVRTEAALALVAVEDRESVLEAVPALLAGLTHPDFLQRDRCAEALIRIGPRCAPFVGQAIASGGVMVGIEAIPLTVAARSEALTILERVKGPVAC